jgi:hypothetical protein
MTRLFDSAAVAAGMDTDNGVFQTHPSSKEDLGNHL